VRPRGSQGLEWFYSSAKYYPETATEPPKDSCISFVFPYLDEHYTDDIQRLLDTSCYRGCR
jgi:hypothetical protein